MNRRIRRNAAMTRSRRRRGAYAVHRDEMEDKFRGVTPEGLVSFALYSPLPEDRMAALGKIEDDDALGRIVTDSMSHTTKIEAIRRMTDTRILKEIVCSTKDADIRNAAIDRVVAIEGDPLRG